MSENTSTNHLDLVDYLTVQLSERVKKNNNYSLRSFARDLNLSPGNLSDLLKRRRKVSPKTVTKICTNLAVSPALTQQFIARLFGNTSAASHHYDESSITEDQFKLICDWRHFAILRLIKTDGFRGTSSWIAKRLGINIYAVNECRDRLVRAGLLEIKGNVWVDRSEGNTSYLKTEGSDQYIKKFLVSMLELSAASVERDAITDRNHTGMMLTISKKSLPEAIELIKTFRRSLAQLLEENKLTKEEVYYLEIGLFPITRKDSK